MRPDCWLTAGVLLLWISSNDGRRRWQLGSRRASPAKSTRVFRNTVSDANRWPRGVIYFEISPALARYESLIYAAMRQIEDSTCIEFEQRFNQPDYVFLVNGDGCHSKVGRIGGRQILSLGSGCHDIGSILHELCHVIGLYHEHMRYDRDQFLKIDWSNIAPSMYDQFQKIPANQYRPASTFDYSSIMIYGSKAFSKNGRKTMIPRRANARIQESHYKRRLSRADIVNINSLYGCA